MTHPSVTADIAKQISHQGLESLLQTKSFGRAMLEIHPSIGSTNVRARELGRDGATEGTLIVADEQTAGRGRLGRAWHSPKGTGIYFSVILRPRAPIDDPARVTLAAGLGAAEAIGRFTGRMPGIKWPNDLLMDGRKIAGLLTEMEYVDEGSLFLIMGMGTNVNLTEGDIPDDLREKAGSLRIATGRAWDREALLAELLAGIEKRYLDLISGGWDRLILDYRRQCVTIGNFVQVRSGKNVVEGEAVDVNDKGRLLVRTADGETLPLDSGEVTLSRSSS